MKLPLDHLRMRVVLVEVLLYDAQVLGVRSIDHVEGIADEHKYEYDQDRAIDGFGRPLPRPEASLTTHDNDHASAAPLRLAQDEDIANGN